MVITHGLNGRVFALYQTNKDKTILYMQVLGVGLLRYKSMKIRVPMLASDSLARKMMKRKLKELSIGSKVPSGLNQFIKEVQKSSKHRVFFKTTSRKFLTVNESDILGKIMPALKKHSLNSRLPKPVEQFQLLCLSLIRSVGPFEASCAFSHDYCHYRVPLSKVCSICHCRSGYEYFNQSKMDITWIENDLEFAVQTVGVGTGFAETAVYTKDACNTMHTGCHYTSPQYLSTYCLLPFIYGFHCSGYNGYPESLHNLLALVFFVFAFLFLRSYSANHSCINW